MDNTNELVNIATTAGHDVEFIPTTIVIPDYLKESIESIVPEWTFNGVYTDLLLIGIHHLDEFSAGDVSNIIPLKNFKAS